MFSRRICMMMLTAGLFLLAATGFAQGPVGSYAIQGAGPDGTEYTGSLTVSDLAETPFYRFDWDAGESYTGLGIHAGEGGYVVVWGSEGAVCQMNLFQMNSDGSLEAVWFDAASADAGFGSELATPKRQGGDRISGSYDVHGKNPDGSEYGGFLLVSPAGDGQYLFVWTSGENSFTGVGFPEEGYVTVVASLDGAEGSCGQSSFLADETGNLSGFWWTTDPEFGVGIEVASKAGGSTPGRPRHRWRDMQPD